MQQREPLRAKGQFWTPDWVAEAMVEYCLQRKPQNLFDPAVGAGAFFRAARAVARRLGARVALRGCEVDRSSLNAARALGVSAADLRGVVRADFIRHPPAGPFDAIVANPPYIRHHRMTPAMKARTKALAARLIGKPLDGRAGLHVFFLLRALELLAPGGRLAFIVPADTVEGVFARPLWEWIARNYRIDGVVTFGANAPPFPNVDTNALILFIARESPRADVRWARCMKRGDALIRFVRADLTSVPGVTVQTRSLDEALRTGLSRPASASNGTGAVLGDFAVVRRGIATGANAFFFVTESAAAEFGLPREYLIPAIGRTRDVRGDRIDRAQIAALSRSGRPTLLFAPDGRAIPAHPRAVQDYLERGARLGLPRRPLIATRKPWFRMESRDVPPFLFAYLGRRQARFIRNDAGVVPLTGFLCVYPRNDSAAARHRLWQVLRHPATTANLALVGKSYGSGAIKVEPRALERLPLPQDVMRATGLVPRGPKSEGKGKG
jgi:hypothetical protein